MSRLRIFRLEQYEIGGIAVTKLSQVAVGAPRITFFLASFVYGLRTGYREERLQPLGR